MERRATPRLPVEGWNLWVEYDGGGASLPLVNLSRSGALALSPLVIPAGEPVRLYLEGYEPRGWLDAVIVRCVGGGPLRQVHLAFRGPLPDGPLRAATGKEYGPRPGCERPGAYDRLCLLPLRPGMLAT